MKHRSKFEKGGMLAFYAPKLFFFFDLDDAKKEAEFELVGDAAVVTIEGPLTHHAEWWWDSYDAILVRVKSAAASPAKRVILKIDSPGGDVSGCFETATAIRDVVKGAGKELVAYADGLAASAGYALACVADEICLPPTAFVGSVGVINSLHDLTSANEKWGVNVAVIASGAKKAIGNPNVAISPDAIAEVQAQVDELAELFFDHVASRRAVTPAQVKALEAGVFIGKSALNAGLADRVCTFDELLATVASGETTGPVGTDTKESKAMAKWKDDMQKAADEGDEEAKKCLQALDGGDDDADKKKDDEKSEDDKTDEKAEDETAPPEDEKKKDEKAAAKHASAGIALVGENLSMSARLERLETAQERTQLLASRPDLMRQPKVKVWLETAPLATVRNAVKSLEKPSAPKPAAAASAAPTVRADVPGQAAANAGMPAEEVSRIRSKMRGGARSIADVNPTGQATRMAGNKQEFLDMTPEQARARLVEIQKERGNAQKGRV